MILVSDIDVVERDVKHQLTNLPERIVSRWDGVKVSKWVRMTRVEAC